MIPCRAVLVSGWATRSRVWAPLLSALHDCILPECVDWWESIDPEGPASTAAALRGGSDPSIGIGWSLGGQLLLDAALRSPARVSALVLISTTARLVADTAYAGAPAAAIRAMRGRLRRDRECVLRDFFTNCFASPDPRVIQTLCRDADGIDDAALEAGLDYLMASDLRPRLGELTVPTLVIHGDRDAVVPLASAQYLADNLGDAELTVLEGAGHAASFSAFDALHRAIRGFLHDRVP